MSQGQFQPPRKTSSAKVNTSSSLRHIYTEDGDVKNRTRTVGHTGAVNRTGSASAAQRTSAARPSVKASASVEIKTNAAPKTASPKKSKKDLQLKRRSL